MPCHAELHALARRLNARGDIVAVDVIESSHRIEIVLDGACLPPAVFRLIGDAEYGLEDVTRRAELVVATIC